MEIIFGTLVTIALAIPFVFGMEMIPREREKTARGIAPPGRENRVLG